jgi:hypothetical protein
MMNGRRLGRGMAVLVGLYLAASCGGSSDLNPSTGYGGTGVPEGTGGLRAVLGGARTASGRGGSPQAGSNGSTLALGGSLGMGGAPMASGGAGGSPRVGGRGGTWGLGGVPGLGGTGGLPACVPGAGCTINCLAGNLACVCVAGILECTWPETGGTTGAGGMPVSTGGAPVSTSGGATSACSGLPFGSSAGGALGSCTGVAVEAELCPLDLMIMMDRSQSMTYALTDGSGRNRWQAVSAAMAQFIADPGSAGVRLGIQFFSMSGGADLTGDCDPLAYQAPAVEIGPISEVGPAITNAMGQIVLSGQTPSRPALQGAIWHAQEWQASNLPGRRTAVLFITDGLPTLCPVPPAMEPSSEDVATVAAAGLLGTPSIRTYVMGVSIGAGRFNLDRIAVAGGTRAGYLVGDTPGVDTATALVAALRSITQDSLVCEYQLPPPVDPLHPLDSSLVRLVQTDAAGNRTEIPWVGTEAQCSAAHGGWYYDGPMAPSRILICPCSCLGLAGNRLEIVIGCQPAAI